MLEEIREKKNNRLAYALLAAAGIGMLFIGFPSLVTHDNTALKINDEVITRDVYQRQRSLLQQQRPDIDEQSLRALTLSTLSSQALLRAHARESGYVLSDQALYAFIKAQFGDEKTYTEMLNRMRTNAQSYEAGLRLDGGVDHYYQALQSALGAPQNRALMEQQLKPLLQTRHYHRYQIALEDLAKAVPVDEAALQEYFQQQSYLSPETVNVRYVRFSAADLPVDVQADDAALKKQSALQGKRRAEYVIFNRIDPAEAAKNALDEGSLDFATLRAQVKDKTIDGEEGDFPLQNFGQTGVPVVDEALFALEKEGDVSEVLVTDFGRMLVRVLEIEEPDTAAVQKALHKQAQEQRYHEQGEKLVERALQGATIDEIAALAHVEVQSLQGLTANRADEPWLQTPSVQSALFGARATAVGKMAEPLLLDDGLTSLFVQIEHRDLPAPLSFEQARAQVQHDYVAAQARVLAQEKQQALESALQAGQTPEQAAAAVGADFAKVSYSRANVPNELADLLFFHRGQKRFMPHEHAGKWALYELTGFEDGALSVEAQALGERLREQVLMLNQATVFGSLQNQFVREQSKQAKVQINIEESQEP